MGPESQSDINEVSHILFLNTPKLQYKRSYWISSTRSSITKTSLSEVSNVSVLSSFLLAPKDNYDEMN